MPNDSYITFTGESSEFTLKATYKTWDGTLEWSTDRINWTVLDGTEEMQSVDKKLYLRGKGNTTFYQSRGVCWKLSEKAGCSGNIQTLLDWENPPKAIPTKKCYSFMFSNCTLLTRSPDLPAIALTDACYSYMFSMCTSLVKPPDLPATTLAYDCYLFIFSNCKGIKISETQTAEYDTAWRIPSNGIVSTTANFWNRNMLSGTGGTFTGYPSINTTYYIPSLTYTINLSSSIIEKKSTTPLIIQEGKTATLTIGIAAQYMDTYTMPYTISVENADYQYEVDGQFASLKLSNPTGNVYVNIIPRGITNKTFQFSHKLSAGIHDIQVSLVNSKNKESALSLPKVISYTPILPAPQNVQINGTTLSWDEVEGATSYNILVDDEVYETINV